MKLKLDKTPRYYYHITRKRWYSEVVLVPRDKGEHRCPSEPLTPRICVAPSPFLCMSAILIDDRLDNIYPVNIYRTAEKITAYYPIGIRDSRITKEHWICESTKFIKVDQIHNSIYNSIINKSYDMDVVYGEMGLALETQKRYKKWLRKYLINIGLQRYIYPE